MDPITHNHIHVVAGLIIGDRRVLACQRSEEAVFPLKWEFPGGKVEHGETDDSALRRELREELGIRVQEMQQVFQQRHIYPSGPAVTLRFFTVLAYDGVLQNLVFRRIMWASLADLKRLDFLEGDQPLILRLVADGGAALLGQRLLA